MVLTEKQLIDSLKAGKYLPVYLITGEDNYYIDIVSDYFEKQVIDPSFSDFDMSIVYGRDVTMHAVVSLAQQFPMMSPIRLVLVKEAQDINIKEWELLSKYLESPQPQTLLVFCYRHKKLDKRIAAYKAIAKVGGICEHAKMRDNDMPDWIGSYVNQHGYAITQRGSMLIAEHIGNDLGKVTNELEKVFISLHQGDTIDEDIIEREIGISKEYNVFELQNAIGRRDVVKCNRIVNHFAANPKDNPIQAVLPNLYNYVIKVMIYHQLEDKSQKNAASALGVHPYFIRDYATAAGNYSLGKLASCIGYIDEADRRSKGIRSANTVTDGEILKELVFKIIH